MQSPHKDLQADDLIETEQPAKQVQAPGSPEKKLHRDVAEQPWKEFVATPLLDFRSCRLHQDPHLYP